MKKFEFSLSRIRDYKNSILSKEKNVLMGLRMEQRSIEERIEQLDELFSEINTEMHEKMKSGINASTIRIYDFRKNNIREEKNALNNRLEFLFSSIELQQKRVEKLRQEVKSYDNLEEKQRAEYNEAVAKEQEDVIAEFVSQKFTREKVNA